MITENVIDNPKRKTAVLAVFSVVHGLVDTVCAVLVFSLVHIYPMQGQEYLLLIVMYNVIAFAMQPLCGLIADRFLTPRSVAIAGLLFSFLAVMSMMHDPWVTVILAGIGNSLFHVGGGVVSIMMKPGHAFFPGVFVAPGAIGLAIGGYIGSRGVVSIQPVISLIVAAIIAVAMCRLSEQENGVRIKSKHVSNRTLIIVFLLLSVALRSLLGFSAGSLWQGNRTIMFLLAIAAMSGKVTGGFLADRFGWILTGTLALVFCTLFFMMGTVWAWGVVCGMLLLQMTMPVTLTALYRVFPGRPGLTFGLCSLALIIGAAPVFSTRATVLNNVIVIICGAIFSIILFSAALILIKRGVPDKKTCFDTSTRSSQPCAIKA